MKKTLDNNSHQFYFSRHIQPKINNYLRNKEINEWLVNNLVSNTKIESARGY